MTRRPRIRRKGESRYPTGRLIPADAAVRDIFFSYAHSDKPVARRLVHELRGRGITCWIDEGELLIGDSLLDRIGDAIEKAEFFVALISEHSVGSPWCRRELRQALIEELENEGNVKVLPLRVGTVQMPSQLKGVYYGTHDPLVDPTAVADELAASVRGFRARRSPPIEPVVGRVPSPPRRTKPSPPPRTRPRPSNSPPRRPSQPTRSSRLAQAAALTPVLVAAAAGLSAGLISAPTSGAAADTARTGAIELRYGDEWSAASPVATPGLDLDPDMRLRHRGVAGGELRLGHLRNAAPGPDPLPDAFRHSLTPPIHRSTTRIGGVVGLSYRARARDPQQGVRVLVIPTRRSYLAALCQGPHARFDVVEPDCNRVISTLRFDRSSAPVMPGPSASFAVALGNIVRQVSDVRRARGEQVGSSSPTVRQRAAFSISGAESRAAGAVERLEPPPQDRAVTAELARAFKADARALGSLALTRNTRGRVARAARQVESTGRVLRRAFRRLRANGYPTTQESKR